MRKASWIVSNAQQNQTLLRDIPIISQEAL